MAARLFVGNLNYSTTSDELQELFSQAGEVIEISIPNDRNTGRPRGFAFVEMASAEEAAEVIEKFDGHELGGRTLRVNEAEERPRKPRFSAPSQSGGADLNIPPAKPKGSRRNLRGRKRRL